MTGGHKGHTSLDKIVSYATLNYIALKDFCAAYYLSSPPCIYLPSIPPPPPRSLSPLHPPPNLSPTLLTHPDGSQFASQQPCLPSCNACAKWQHVQTKRYTRETHKSFLILNMDVIVLCLLKYFASPTRCSSCIQIACYYFEVLKLLVRCEMCVCQVFCCCLEKKHQPSKGANRCRMVLLEFLLVGNPNHCLLLLPSSANKFDLSFLKKD